jgi:hypothetical protein
LATTFDSVLSVPSKACSTSSCTCAQCGMWALRQGPKDVERGAGRGKRQVEIGRQAVQQSFHTGEPIAPSTCPLSFDKATRTSLKLYSGTTLGDGEGFMWVYVVLCKFTWVDVSR